VNRFQALVVTKGEDGQTLERRVLERDQLMDGDVTVRVTHSTVNYKDGLALTGKAPIIRRSPMVPGIDFSGIVEDSSHPDWSAGDEVIATGWGMGEGHFGAYAGLARVKGDWLVPVPDGLDRARAMAIGTAGFTAMLCVLALEKAEISPDRGPLVVTGAAGGVGSVAVAVLSKLGYKVVASTGRKEEAGYLRSLGAGEIMDRQELSGPAKPMAKERWAGGVDAVGSHTLANVLAMTMAEGAVAACGNAGGLDLPTSVAPFILRGVSLLGINSVTAPKEKRLQAWSRLARDLDRDKLDAMTRTIGFGDIEQAAQDILNGQVRGRLVVEMGDLSA
jgi:acrylyl-CoA reductase (NADPH)